MSGEKQKWGEGHRQAWLRSGFKELASILPAFKDSVPVQEEPGLFGNPTTYEVSKQTGSVKKKGDREPDREP